MNKHINQLNQVQQENTIHKINIWLNAFIPREFETATQPVPSGIHQGKTMWPLSGPTIIGYLTDQRNFDPSPDAQSRMHSEVEIDLDQPRIVRQSHRCDATVEIGRDGAVTCEECADSSAMQFSPLHVAEDGLTFEIDLTGSSKNACLKIGEFRPSPNLDYEGKITIKLDASRTKALVWFRGQIEIYPAFEMYACVDGHSAQPLFRLDPESGSGPGNLFGRPARDVYGEVELVV